MSFSKKAKNTAKKIDQVHGKGSKTRALYTNTPQQKYTVNNEAHLGERALWDAFTNPSFDKSLLPTRATTDLTPDTTTGELANVSATSLNKNPQNFKVKEAHKEGIENTYKKITSKFINGRSAQMAIVQEGTSGLNDSTMKLEGQEFKNVSPYTSQIGMGAVIELYGRHDKDIMDLYKTNFKQQGGKHPINTSGNDEIDTKMMNLVNERILSKGAIGTAVKHPSDAGRSTPSILKPYANLEETRRKTLVLSSQKTNATGQADFDGDTIGWMNTSKMVKGANRVEKIKNVIGDINKAIGEYRFNENKTISEEAYDKIKTANINVTSSINNLNSVGDILSTLGQHEAYTKQVMDQGYTAPNISKEKKATSTKLMTDEGKMTTTTNAVNLPQITSGLTNLATAIQPFKGDISIEGSEASVINAMERNSAGADPRKTANANKIVRGSFPDYLEGMNNMTFTDGKKTGLSFDQVTGKYSQAVDFVEATDSGRITGEGQIVSPFGDSLIYKAEGTQGKDFLDSIKSKTDGETTFGRGSIMQYVNPATHNDPTIQTPNLATYLRAVEGGQRLDNQTKNADQAGMIAKQLKLNFLKNADNKFADWNEFQAVASEVNDLGKAIPKASLQAKRTQGTEIYAPDLHYDTEGSEYNPSGRFTQNDQMGDNKSFSFKMPFVAVPGQDNKILKFEGMASKDLNVQLATVLQVYKQNAYDWYKQLKANPKAGESTFADNAALSGHSYFTRPNFNIMNGMPFKPQTNSEIASGTPVEVDGRTTDYKGSNDPVNQLVDALGGVVSKKGVEPKLLASTKKLTELSGVKTDKGNLVETDQSNTPKVRQIDIPMSHNAADQGFWAQPVTAENLQKLPGMLKDAYRNIENAGRIAINNYHIANGDITKVNIQGLENFYGTTKYTNPNTVPAKLAINSEDGSTAISNKEANLVNNFTQELNAMYGARITGASLGISEDSYLAKAIGDDLYRYNSSAITNNIDYSHIPAIAQQNASSLLPGSIQLDGAPKEKYDFMPTFNEVMTSLENKNLVPSNPNINLGDWGGKQFNDVVTNINFKNGDSVGVPSKISQIYVNPVKGVNQRDAQNLGANNLTGIYKKMAENSIRTTADEQKFVDMRGYTANGKPVKVGDHPIKTALASDRVGFYGEMIRNPLVYANLSLEGGKFATDDDGIAANQIKLDQEVGEKDVVPGLMEGATKQVILAKNKGKDEKSIDATSNYLAETVYKNTPGTENFNKSVTKIKTLVKQLLINTARTVETSNFFEKNEIKATDAQKEFANFIANEAIIGQIQGAKKGEVPFAKSVTDIGSIISKGLVANSEVIKNLENPEVNVINIPGDEQGLSALSANLDIIQKPKPVKVSEVGKKGFKNPNKKVKYPEAYKPEKLAQVINFSNGGGKKK